jgi:hypothetical protein
MKKGCTFLIKTSAGLYYQLCREFNDSKVTSICYNRPARRFNNPVCDGHNDTMKNVVAITSLPTLLKYDYKEHDDVYVWIGDSLRKGTIKKVDSSFLVHTVIYPNIVCKPEELLPYKWWKLYEKCKLAVMETSKCLVKFRIYKDVRLLVAKAIWNTRNDYSWMCNHKHTKSRKVHKKIKSYKE